jgi:hypothetical protein
MEVSAHMLTERMKHAAVTLGVGLEWEPTGKRGYGILRTSTGTAGIALAGSIWQPVSRDVAVTALAAIEHLIWAGHLQTNGGKAGT